MINANVHSPHRCLSILFAITVVCILLLMTCTGISSDPNSRVSGNESVADSNDDANDSNGPTIMLSYNKETLKENPIFSFAYFIPLISPALVDRETSVDFVVRPWVNASDYWAVYFDITLKIKLALDQSGITIPYPQSDVHIKDGKAKAAVA